MLGDFRTTPDWEEGNMRSSVFAGTALALTMTLTGIVSAQEVVRIAEPTWASARAISGLIKVIIEDKMGGKAEIVPGNNAVIFKAMDRGKGDIDVHPDVWLPNQSNFTQEYVDTKGTVALSKNGYVGRGGFCMSKTVAAENNVKSIYDLATPEAAKLTDRDGNGKGDIWVGAPGWAATKANSVKVRDYGIGNFFDAIQAEEEVATAAISDADTKKEGYAYYCYAPHFSWFVYDQVMLEEPPYDPENYKMVQPTEDPEWFEKSRVTSADREKSIHVGYSRSLETRAPEIAKFLSNIELDTDTVNNFTFELVVKKRSSTIIAGEWVAANSDRVDQWLGLKN